MLNTFWNNIEHKSEFEKVIKEPISFEISERNTDTVKLSDKIIIGKVIPFYKTLGWRAIEYVMALKAKRLRFLSPWTIPDITIDRNLKDDTFSVHFAYSGINDGNISKLIRNGISRNMLVNMPVIQINGKYMTNKTDIIDTFPNNREFQKQYLNNFKFSKIKNLIVGVSPNFDSNIFMLFNINTDRTFFEDKIFLQSNNVLHLKYLNKIKIDINQNNVIQRGIINYDVTRSYFNILLKPVQIKQQKRIKKIFYLSAWNDDFSSINNDLYPLEGKTSNLLFNNISHNMSTIYHPGNHDEVIMGHRVIGDIELNDMSYYDYDKNGTFFGTSGEDARLGYVIPYNFKGVLRPELQLPFNQSDWPLKIITEYKFNSKLLDYGEGIIRLFIAETNQKISFKNNFKVSNKVFVDIIKNNYSLEMLRRLSEEVG